MIFQKKKDLLSKVEFEFMNDVFCECGQKKIINDYLDVEEGGKLKTKPPSTPSNFEEKKFEKDFIINKEDKKKFTERVGVEITINFLFKLFIKVKIQIKKDVKFEIKWFILDFFLDLREYILIIIGVIIENFFHFF